MSKPAVLIRNEGQPVPIPDYFDGTEDDRVIIINSALWDVREKDPQATSYRVAEWGRRLSDPLGIASRARRWGDEPHMSGRAKSIHAGGAPSRRDRSSADA